MEFDNQGMLQRESVPKREDDASEIMKVRLANNPPGLLPIRCLWRSPSGQFTDTKTLL